MIRSIHFADVHDSPEFHPVVKPAVDFIVDYILREQPDFVAFWGDATVRRGHLNPLESWYLRTAFLEIAKVCPLVIIPGNHDDFHSLTGVDSLTGILGYGDGKSLHPNIHLVTRASVVRITIASADTVQLLCVPFPSRQMYTPGRDLDPIEANREMGRLVGEMVRGLGETLSPHLPTVFGFHGSIEHGKAGPEVAMTSEQEFVLKHGDIPDQALFCVGGHLHIPHQTGRFVYTGAPACHTFHEERVNPSFVEARFYRPTEDVEKWGKDPNLGYKTLSRWKVRYDHLPVPSSLPLLTLDYRRQNLGEDPVGAARSLMNDRSTDIDGSRVRIRLSIPVAQRRLLSSEQIESYAVEKGAVDAKAIIETRPDILVRSKDVHSGVSFEDGLNLWLKTQPDYEPYRDELTRLSRVVESRLTPEQRVEVQPVDVRPLRHGWSNWKQYGEDNVVDLSAMGGLTAVVGDNMAGKSNFAEVTAFVRWGVLRGALMSSGPSRSVLRHAVRSDQKSMTAWEVFEAAGATWRIDRSVALTATAHKSSLTLAKWRPETPYDPAMDSPLQWTPESAETANQTQAKIVKLVGTLERYLAMSFSSQNDLTRIIDMGHAEFMTTMQDACNTKAWDHREKVATTVQSEVEAEILVEDGKRAKVAEQSVDIEQAIRSEAMASSALAESEQVVATLSDEVRAAEAEVTRAETMGHDLTALESSLRSAVEREQGREADYHEAKTSHDAAFRRKSMAEHRLHEAEAADRELPIWQAKVDECERLEADQKALMDARSKRDALRSEARDVLSRVALLESEHARTLAEWRSKRHALEADCAGALALLDRAERHWLSEQKAAQDAVAAAERRSALLGQLPGCNPHDPGDTAKNERCPLLSDALTARNALEALVARVVALEVVPDAVLVARTSVNQAEENIRLWDEAEPIPRSEEKDRLVAEAAEISARAEACPYNDERWGANEGRLAVLYRENPRERLGALREARQATEERRATLAVESGAVEAAEARLQRARAAADEATTERGRIQIELDRIRADRGGELDRLRLRLGQLKERFGVVSQEHATLIERRTLMRERLERARAAAEELAAIDAAVAVKRRTLTAATILRNACSRQGVPYLILEQALPLFEATANEFLEDTELRTQVVSLGDDGVERGFLDDSGWHPLTEASGFARAILGMANRWALAVVASTMSGTRIRSYVIDEGFGVFRENNLTVAQTVLRKMAQKPGVDRVVVISHVPAIIEAADRILTVHRSDNGSYITGPPEVVVSSGKRTA